MSIGSVHGATKEIKTATQNVVVATNGGVAMRSVPQSELGMPPDSKVILAQVHPKHRADVDDVWTAVFYGYSWDDKKRSVEIAVNGRLTGLQKQEFEVNVLYY